MASKSPEDWISFLLTCIDYTEAKPNWSAIANDTGAYKSGKFVNQAYTNLRKKYNPLPLVGETSAAPATPGSNKKRNLVDDLVEDDVELTPKSKRPRKTKTPKKQVKEKLVRANDEESVDELEGDATVGHQNGGDED